MARQGKGKAGAPCAIQPSILARPALSSPASNGPRESTDQLARTRWPGPSQGRSRYATNLTGLMVIAEGGQTACTSMPVVGVVDPTLYLGARRELEWEARRMHRREQSCLERWRKSPHVYCSVFTRFSCCIIRFRE